MSKILFVTAPYHCWGVQVVGTWPPLHMAYLAGAALDAGHEAKIYDAMNKRHSFEYIRQEIESYQPDFVMTLDEVTQALGTCYMKFYSKKMQEIVDLEDCFKRRYMLSAFRHMMRDHGDHFDFEGSGIETHYSIYTTDRPTHYSIEGA